MFFHKSKKDHLPTKLVMAFGTFDYLHAGHENFLKQARKLGTELIVIIARDTTVRSVKGRLPVNNEKTRVKNLRQTGWADQVVLGNQTDKHKVILQHKPAVIALGYDQYVFTQTLQKTLIDHNLDSEIIRLEAYFPQVYKSSLIRQQLEGDKTAPAVTPSRIGHQA
jgi:FAD synthetase